MKKLILFLFLLPLFVSAQIQMSQVNGLIPKLNSKQDSLVSGVNIKTINGSSLKGSGNLSIVAGGGGAGANVYLSDVNSSVSGYKTSSPNIDATESVKTITASAPNTVYWGEKYLYTSPIAITNIPSGLWSLHAFGHVNSAVGVSSVVFRIFKYSGSTETVLFTFTGYEVDNLESSEIIVTGGGTETALLATDYLGIQVGFQTTAATAKTLTYTIGNGHASYSTNPLPLRHAGLRDKNGETDFQHVTTTQINTWNGKQNQINGTGFVKVSGTTLSYDNSTYSTDIHSNIIALNDVSGSNHGDETLTSIKTKLGAANSTTDGYLKYQDWLNFNSKQNSITDTYYSYSMFRNTGLKTLNGSITAIGDSNLEGYISTGIGDNNWFSIVKKNLKDIHGSETGIGFSNFNDPERYGLTYNGAMSIVRTGCTNTAIKLANNSSITFIGATDAVEFVYDGNVSGGTIELYYNGSLYKTIYCNSDNIKNKSTFNSNENQSPSSDSGLYMVKAIGGDVVISVLYNNIHYTDKYDCYYFTREAVAGCTFQDFNVSNIKNTRGFSSENSLYILALGTNSIYSPTKATSSDQFKVDLAMYFDSLSTDGNKIVYVIPPITLETTYPHILEPYLNYYFKILDVCKDYNIPYIDLNKIGLSSSDFGSDGLHYSNAGHIKIAKYITNQLAKIDNSLLNYSTKTGKNSKWGGATYNGGILATNPYYLLSYDTSHGDWRSIDATQAKSYLGLGTAAFKNSYEFIYSSNAEAQLADIWTSGRIHSNSEIASKADGSDIIGDGARLSLYNRVGNKSFSMQLNSNYGMDMWSYYDVGWQKRFSFSRDGVFSATSFVGNGSNLTGVQLPITLTTNGTSGAATFSGNVLNVPNYSGGSVASGTYSTSLSSIANTSALNSTGGIYNDINGIITYSFQVEITATTTNPQIRFSLPVASNGTSYITVQITGQKATTYTTLGFNDSTHINLGMLVASTGYGIYYITVMYK